MDSTSSPLSGNPEPSTAPSSATRQPTYTTAGTIYDPSSAAPLQPPARRGRALRGTMATSQADTIYQPKPVFETMPPLGRNAANRANLRHQYTPLQQNYDRASGPSRESGMVFLRSDMPARLSNAVNGKITEPTSPLPSQLDEHGQDDREYNHVRSKDQYRDDEDMASKPLQGLPINSLHNLASYPNPHRDNARRVILAASSDVSEQMRNSTQSGSWGHATPRGITALDRDASYFENTSTSTATFLPYGTSATGQGPVSSSAGDRLLSSATSPGLSPYTTGTGPVQYRDNKTSAAEGSLSLGLGAPKPLTAGPPGARQYRRPVLETTVQSVRPNSDTEAVDDLEDSSGDGLATSPNTTNAVFLPSTTPSPSESLSNRWHDARNLKKGAAGLAAFVPT
ncbi:hypothetical protein B0I35DRAFT_484091 [Stachybotrys elegans]|uniref:Uncharacterized protein n=1 Tax=Stachybotrys elegans TaxID=80388 RepID=A0A8K0SAL8_9HYPO|nr:hypothetical protein B0I35DRAFT_484091 [Stachybotrys elegans]